MDQIPAVVRRKYVRKIKPPELTEPLPRLKISPAVNLDAFPAIFDSTSLSPTNVDITIPRQNQEIFNESFSTDAPQTDYITEVPLINNFVADGLPADNDSEIMLFLRNEFQSLKIQLDSTNALLRQNLGLSKQNSKNMKTYFDNQSFDGFLSEYEIV